MVFAFCTLIGPLPVMVAAPADPAMVVPDPLRVSVFAPKANVPSTVRLPLTCNVLDMVRDVPAPTDNAPETTTGTAEVDAPVPARVRLRLIVHVPPVGAILAVAVVVRSKFTVKLAVPFRVAPVKMLTKSAVAEVVTTETVWPGFM